VFGSKLWSYHQTIEWCWNGSTITSLYRNRWAEIHDFTWVFHDHIGDSTSGGIGSWSYTAFTQGSFSQCLGSECWTYQYPWLEQRVYANGSAQYRTDYNTTWRWY